MKLILKNLDQPLQPPANWLDYGVWLGS